MLRGRWVEGRGRTPGAGGHPGRGRRRARTACQRKKGAEQASLENDGREGRPERDRPTRQMLRTPGTAKGWVFIFVL